MSGPLQTIQGQWPSSHGLEPMAQCAECPIGLAFTRDGLSLAWSPVVTNHPFLPLRHRAVRLLWSAAVVSDIGTWVQLIVVGSLVAANTGSALQTGLVALATFAPQSIACPVGGLLADRFDRRKVFATALMVQALVTTALAVTLGLGVREPAVLIILILLASAAGATGAPSYAAMQPDLVPPEELMAMVSLGVYSWNSGRIIGPLLGTARRVGGRPGLDDRLQRCFVRGHGRGRGAGSTIVPTDTW